MKYLCAIIISLLASSAAVHGYSCGGLLEGDAGELQFPIEGNADGESNCLWIIKLLSGSGIRFTLTKLGSAGVVSLYPEHEATETVLTPIRLEATSINSTILATGKVLIVTLSKSSTSSGVSFTWESDVEGNTGAVKAASYVDTPEGRVSFSKFGQAERLTFGLGVDPSTNLKIHATTDFGRCNLLDPCMCTYFALYEVTPEGYLREATRVCGRPSEAVIENLYSQLVAFIYVNTTGAADPTAFVELTWAASSSDEVTTTTTTTTVETTTSGPPSQQLECGGIINIDYTAANPEVFYAEYKLDTMYDNNEFCIWTINSTGDPWNNLQVTLVEEGFQRGRDAIDAYTIVYDTSISTSLSRCSLFTSNVTCTLNDGVGILAFTSDSSLGSSGFKVSLAPSGTRLDPQSAFHFTESEVVFNYPVGGGNYPFYDQVTMVFQRFGPNYLAITRLDTEIRRDFLSVYTIYPHYSGLIPKLDGTYSGSYPDGVPGSQSYSINPRIAIFTSDSTIAGQGFEITLRSELGSETTETPTTTSEPLPPVEQLECGGIINIDYTAANPQVFYVEYKLDTMYDNNEFCIWTVNSTGDIWNDLQVTLIEQAFERGRDAIETYSIYYSTSSTTGLSLCSLITTNATCTLNYGVGILAFTSDGSVPSSGFRISLAPSGVRSRPHSAFHFAESEVVFNYPVGGGNYPVYDQVTMVFQRFGPNYLEITRLQTELDVDKLSVYTIYPYYTGALPHQDGLYSGNYPDGVAGSLSYSINPRIVIFTSDADASREGFEITLRSELQMETTEAPTTTSEPLPPAVQLACGGIINVTVDEAIYVEYKADINYDNNEFCIWTLESPTRWGTAAVTAESSFFENCCDGIEVFYLTMTSTLDASFDKIRLSDTNDYAVLQNGIGFIAFSSDFANRRPGFRLRIEATPATVTNRYESTFFIDEPEGAFKYPEQGLYRANDRVLTILQLPSSNFLKISSLETESGYDVLHIFDIPTYKQNASVTHQGGWAGSYPDGVASSTTTSASPRAVLLASDNSNQFSGFQIQWGENSAAQEVSEVQPKKMPFNFPKTGST